MPQNQNKPDYEKLGRMLETLYETGYVSHGKMYRMTFIKGVIAGFGGVIGATVVVAILLWVLSLFHNVPFVNKISDNVSESVQTTQPQQAK